MIIQMILMKMIKRRILKIKELKIILTRLEKLFRKKIKKPKSMLKNKSTNQLQSTTASIKEILSLDLTLNHNTNYNINKILLILDLSLLILLRISHLVVTYIMNLVSKPQ